MANTTITRNEADPVGNTTTFTLSQWVKRSKISAEQAIVSHRYTNTYYFHVRFNDNDTMNIEEYNNGQTLLLTTNRKFRDVNGWYHIVVACDTTQSTASNRIKLYINGVQETSFSTANYPSQNANLVIDGGAGYVRNYGDRGDGAMYFDGAMSHIHYTQGTAYDSSAFGSTDSTTGEWKINPGPSVTYGSKGYFILKDGNSVTDQSGNSNNFTVASGNLTNTEDCPSNVFTTWNMLANFNNTLTFSEGNLKGIANSTSSTWFSARATLGFTSGKWYWETKFTGLTDPVPAYIGVVDESAALNINDAHNSNGNTLYYNGSGGEMRVDGSATSNDYGNFSTSDICGVAVNADDNLITIYKNGSAIITDYALSTTRTGFLFPTAAATNTSSGTNSNGLITNFGSPPFAISSGNTDGNGYGNFEYAVPSGYYALNTANLAEFG